MKKIFIIRKRMEVSQCMKKVLLALATSEAVDYLLKNATADTYTIVGENIPYLEGIIYGIKQHKPDILVLQEMLPGSISPLELVIKVKEQFSTRIIFIANIEHSPGEEIFTKLIHLNVLDILYGTVKSISIIEHIKKAAEYKDVMYLGQREVVRKSEPNLIMLEEGEANYQTEAIDDARNKRYQRPTINLEPDELPLPEELVSRDNTTSQPSKMENRENLPDGRDRLSKLLNKDGNTGVTIAPAVSISEPRREMPKVEADEESEGIEEDEMPSQKKKRKLFGNKNKKQEVIETNYPPPIPNDEPSPSITFNEDVFPLPREVDESEEEDYTERKGGFFGKTKGKKNKGNRSAKSIVSFVGAKHGVGNTTVALNVAVRLAQEGKKVIYLEMNNINPLVNFTFELREKSMVKGIDSAIDNINLKQLEQIPEGIIKAELVHRGIEMSRNQEIDVVNMKKGEIHFMFYSDTTFTSNYSPMEIDLGDIRTLILYLSKQMGYEYVILDAPFIPEESLVTLFTYSDRIFTTITPEQSSLAYFNQYVKGYEEKGLSYFSKNVFIINFYESKAKNIKAYIQDLTTLVDKRAEFIKIPYQFEALDALYRGETLVQNKLKDFINQIDEIIEKI